MRELPWDRARELSRRLLPDAADGDARPRARLPPGSGGRPLEGDPRRRRSCTGAALSFAALRGRRKIAIVTPADAMNERAQNTLLKTLEEPPPRTRS